MIVIRRFPALHKRVACNDEQELYLRWADRFERGRVQIFDDWYLLPQPATYPLGAPIARSV